MWNRNELKQKAKIAFKRNYWYCVLVALVLALLVGSSAGGTSRQDNGEEHPAPIPTKISVSVSVVSALTLLNIFVFAPLKVGGKKFFVDNTDEKAPLGDLGAGFTGNYGRNVLAMFLTNLFAALWTLVFIIPGLVKVYSYRMVPYILADHPEIGAMDAITLSRQMMKGNKWKSFVLDISFIGWVLLSALTLGLLSIFYVDPYIEATNAELYRALSGNAAA